MQQQLPVVQGRLARMMLFDGNLRMCAIVAVMRGREPQGMAACQDSGTLQDMAAIPGAHPLFSAKSWLFPYSPGRFSSGLPYPLPWWFRFFS